MQAVVKENYCSLILQIHMQQQYQQLFLLPHPPLFVVYNILRTLSINQQRTHVRKLPTYT